MKRDLAGTCADGVRKKAKYLQEAMDSQQQAAEEHHHAMAQTMEGMEKNANEIIS